VIDGRASGRMDKGNDETGRALLGSYVRSCASKIKLALILILNIDFEMRIFYYYGFDEEKLIKGNVSNHF
jgi:hypothetical protein